MKKRLNEFILGCAEMIIGIIMIFGVMIPLLLFGICTSPIWVVVYIITGFNYSTFIFEKINYLPLSKNL